jgi:tight adherence protein C
VLRDLRLGHTRRHALEAFAERTELEEVSDFVTAVVQAEERGNPLAKVLRIQAEVLRQRRTVKGEEAAAKASVMLIVPLVMLIMSVLVVILAPLLLRSMSAFAGA